MIHPVLIIYMNLIDTLLRLNNPYLGNIYIADLFNQRIRKVTVSTGIISTIAGSSTSGSYSGDTGQATSAALNYPQGVALDSAGISLTNIVTLLFFYQSFSLYLDNIYIADYYNNRVRKVTVSTGIITTIAGTGSITFIGNNIQATSAGMYQPTGLTLDSAGILFIFICKITYLFSLLLYLGNVYIADLGNCRIRKVTVSTGIITTVAGTGSYSYSGDNGPATSAALQLPWGITFDSLGNFLQLFLYFL